MFCKYCGEKISYTSKWCGHCGKETPSLHRYRKAVHRTDVRESIADSSRKSVESSDAGQSPEGDLTSFIENTVAVNELKSSFSGNAAQAGGAPIFDKSRPLFDSDVTQRSVSAAAEDTRPVYDSDVTQRSVSAAVEDTKPVYDSDVTQRTVSAFSDQTEPANVSSDRFSDSETANAQNPAASFNRSGDLVGYPGEEDVPSGQRKVKKRVHKKKGSRKKVRIIAGIAAGFLIAGLFGFGLGRIFPKSSHPETDRVRESGDTVESSLQDRTPEAGSSEGEKHDPEPSSAADVTESTNGSAEGGESKPDETNPGDEPPITETPANIDAGGSVNHDTRSAVAATTADTAGADPGTAENIEEHDVNGPNIGGDVQVDSQDDYL